ncbi:MAG: P-loop ATPase, Sll1717 family [Pseudomonadota bacterium]
MSEFLEEIENWKLEAKLEDNRRYFYHTRIVSKILKGQKLYVVGRKGTGKTAITEHLHSIDERGYFSQKLTFKNFPFNKLYELKDQGYTAPNQHITLWKYVIYSTICRLMKDNPTIDRDTRDKLNNLFNDDVENALSQAVERWTGFKFDLKVLGSGVGFENNKEYATDNGDWTRRVETLENFLSQQVGADKYVIMFDELDEDYKDIIEPEKYRQYTELLTSLFKAVQDVRSKFSGHQLFPVVFIRDDIYDVLQDSDKTKWIDYKVDLEWDESSIKNLLAFRLSRALDKNAHPKQFNEVWVRLFEAGQVKYGHKKQKGISPFKYITRSSLLRPRDYIRYLQVCAENALERGHGKIKPNIVSESDKSFSNYLRSELEDEVHGVIPDIHRILDLFTVLRKQTLRIDEFKEAFDSAVEDGLIRTKDYQFVLQMLFHFSIIGNQPKQASHQVFRYKDKEARLNMKENIILHRGLFRSLQIL